MSDPDAVTGGIAGIQDIAVEGEQKQRSKRGLLLVVLLLLLLCAITSVVDVWINRGPDQARFVTRNIECLQCHTDLIPDMSRAAVHNPFLLKECTVCHTPHGQEVERSTYAGASRTWKRIRTLVEWLPLKWVFSVYDSVAGVSDSDVGGALISTSTQQVKGEESYLVAPIDEICWICHGNLGAKRMESYPHAPFFGGYCTNCHDPHSSDYRVLLVQDERDLCVTCHPVAVEMGRDQLHPPYEGRYCTNCHDPHASSWRGMLVDNQRDLCFTCHPSVAPLSLKNVQHQPFQYDNCTGCHEPHGSDYEPLLIRDSPSLCYSCHPTIEKDFLRPSHHPVDTVDLECEGCHNPHAADYSALLVARDNSLCFTCHTAYPTAAAYNDSAHGTQDVLCIGCHTPHGSNYAPILRDSNPQLCFDCHEPLYFDENPFGTDGNNRNHPVRPVHYDVNGGVPLTCSSTCHDPHGTTYSFMLKDYNHPEDGTCLLCHKTAVGNRVGLDY